MGHPSGEKSELRYKDVEAALAALHGIVEPELLAFRAELRHFRNIGIPELPKFGSGNPIAYSLDDLHQIFLALELHAVAPPAAIAAFIKREWPKIQRTLNHAQHDARDSILLVGSGGFPDEPQLFFAGAPFVDKANRADVARELFETGRKKAPIVIVFLKERLRELDRALNDVLANRRYVDAVRAVQKG